MPDWVFKIIGIFVSHQHPPIYGYHKIQEMLPPRRNVLVEFVCWRETPLSNFSLPLTLNSLILLLNLFHVQKNQISYGNGVDLSVVNSSCGLLEVIIC